MSEELHEKHPMMISVQDMNSLKLFMTYTTKSGKIRFLE
jgi:hypothetical protein